MGPYRKHPASSALMYTLPSLGLQVTVTVAPLMVYLIANPDELGRRTTASPARALQCVCLAPAEGAERVKRVNGSRDG